MRKIRLHILLQAQARLALLLAAALPPSALLAQRPSPYASKVLHYAPGRGAFAPFNDPKKALGVPSGAGRTSGSLDVVTLGIGGSLTLGFARPITDGPGADFLVFENAFIVGLGIRCYAELFFVEVSSNGRDFARFPVSYAGPQKSLGPFGSLVPGSWKGFGGSTPVYANPTRLPAVDPRDPARAGGDAFDLRVLRSHPLVKANKLNLFHVTQIRLVDVEDAKHRDARGRLIRDPSLGSADIEGVAVLNFFGYPQRQRPYASLELTTARRIRLEIGDPDGLKDLNPWRLYMSAQGDPLELGAFLSLCRVLRADKQKLVFETVFSVPRDLPIVLALSAKDLAGHLTGTSLVLH